MATATTAASQLESQTRKNRPPMHDLLIVNAHTHTDTHPSYLPFAQPCLFSVFRAVFVSVSKRRAKWLSYCLFSETTNNAADSWHLNHSIAHHLARSSIEVEERAVVFHGRCLWTFQSKSIQSHDILTRSKFDGSHRSGAHLQQTPVFSFLRSIELAHRANRFFFPFCCWCSLLINWLEQR